MKKEIAKNIFIGFFLGLLSNIFGSVLYILIFSEYGIKTSIEIAREQGVVGNIIGLGALLNLALFFYFLKNNRYYRARGVIMATIFAALLILFSKIF